MANVAWTVSQCRRFAEAYHRNGGNAARAMGEVAPYLAESSLNAHGANLLAREEVQRELRELSALQVVGFLSMEEKRKFLADLVRANPRSVMDGNSHLVQSMTLTRKINEAGEVEERVTVKIPDKLKAIQLDSMLTGELKGNGDEVGEALAPLADGLKALMGLATPPPALPAPDPLSDIL